jgi:adenine-specific DNA methylase
MMKWANKNLGLLGAESFQRFVSIQKNNELLKDRVVLRNALLDFIADFSNWDNSTNDEYILTAQRLVKSAQHSLAGSDVPMVVDPFAGGGAIPLEALRVGADVFASDVNPLSILINKTILQFAPKYGERLASDIENWVASASGQVSKALGDFYPDEKDGSKPIVYLWARTVISEAPDENNIPVEIPLIRSMWLSKKGELVALRWKRDLSGNVLTTENNVIYSNGTTLKVRRPVLEIFTPSSSSEVGKGTVARNAATCPVTGHVTSAKSVQTQLIERMGGAYDARMYCVVSVSPDRPGRIYRTPSEEQLHAYEKSMIQYKSKSSEVIDGISIFPDEVLPIMSGVFNAPIYGHKTWGSLFNYRQSLSLIEYIRIARTTIKDLGKIDKDYQKAFAAIVGILIDRLADLNAALCVWQLSTPNTAHVFGRWALPMIMDYGEVNPLAGAGGSPESSVWRISASLRDIAGSIKKSGEVVFASADEHPMPDDSVDLMFTDPPYYNAIPYADISDFFYVWLKRSIKSEYPDLFSDELIDKKFEICEMSGWDPIRYPHKDKQFFEDGMMRAASRAREYVKPTGLAVVVFAHKSTAGWEALLQALVDAGWVITASWPIDTEMASRLRAKKSAVLASSVHLVCRPRENQDGTIREDAVGDWREVLQELPIRIHEWMPRLNEEGIVGADAIFACLGPALEIFSKYARVERASGESVTLREYLEHVWAAVAKEAMTLVFKGVSAEGFEPDSRLTAMWLWTLRTDDIPESEDNSGPEESLDEDSDAGNKKTSGFELEYDAARKIAQGLGANLELLTNLVEVKGDTARMLSVAERAHFLFGKQTPLPAVTRTRGRQKQQALPGFEEVIEESVGFGLGGNTGKLGLTILDRVHQAMLLFGAGRSEAMKSFLVDEGVGQDARFWRLAQACSALYPRHTQEKRWVDGLLGRKKSLGF